MKTAKILLLISAVLFLLFGIGYGYYGGFSKITLEIERVGGEILVFEEIKGDYSQSTAVSDRVYQKLVDNHAIRTTKGFGIYYNNPKTTPEDELRADVGCVLESDFDRKEALEDDFQIRQYPKGDYLIAEFPFKGGPSVFLGIMKVYPMINSYVEKNEYEVDSPVMEIWDVPNKKIVYRKTLIKIES